MIEGKAFRKLSKYFLTKPASGIIVYLDKIQIRQYSN